MISDRTLTRFFRSHAFVSLTGDLIRALLATLALSLAALWLLYYSLLAGEMYTTLHMNDFGKFYYSTKAFLDGRDMYAPNPATAIPVGEHESWQFGNMNPPHFHLVIIPLARLSPLNALLVWTILGVAALAMSIMLIARDLNLRWTWARAVWTIVAAILCSATGAEVVTGQVTFLLMLPVTLAWIAWRHNDWPRAAIYLGVLSSIKPFLALFGIYLILTRRFRAALTMAGTAGACALLGVVVFGFRAYVAWLHSLSSVNWAWAPMNGSVEGLVSRAFADNPFFTPVVHAPKLATPIAIVLELAIAGFSLLALARDDSSGSADRAFLGLLLTALVVSPLGWIYYLWFIAGPALALLRTRQDYPSPWRNRFLVLAVPGLVAPLFETGWWHDHFWAAVTLGSTYTWTLLALWAAVMLDGRAANPVAPETVSS